MIDEARLARLEVRLEAVIAGVSGIADVLEIHTDALQRIEVSLGEMREWLERPASTELTDLLRGLVAEVAALTRKVDDLPAVVARAVIDGEVGP